MDMLELGLKLIHQRAVGLRIRWEPRRPGYLATENLCIVSDE